MRFYTNRRFNRRVSSYAIAPRRRKSAVKVSAPDIGATVRLCARQIRRPYANREFAPIVSRQPLPAAAAARALSSLSASPSPPPSLPRSPARPFAEPAPACGPAASEIGGRLLPLREIKSANRSTHHLPSLSLFLLLCPRPYLRGEKWRAKGPSAFGGGENNPSLGRPGVSARIRAAFAARFDERTSFGLQLISRNAARSGGWIKNCK